MRGIIMPPLSGKFQPGFPRLTQGWQICHALKHGCNTTQCFAAPHPMHTTLATNNNMHVAASLADLCKSVLPCGLSCQFCRCMHYPDAICPKSPQSPAADTIEQAATLEISDACTMGKRTRREQHMHHKGVSAGCILQHPMTGHLS